jgi:hypothetical protein
MVNHCRLGLKIQLESLINEDKRAWLIPVFEANELERFRTVCEKTATSAALILNHPASSAVSANQKNRWPHTRGRISVVPHGISPSSAY